MFELKTTYKIPSGHWVACTHKGSLICSGVDIELVLERATELGHKNPVIHKEIDFINSYEIGIEQ